MTDQSNIFYSKPIYDPDLLQKCPYCWKDNDKIFRRARKCELCWNKVYLFAWDDLKKRLYTKEQLDKLLNEKKEREHSLWISSIKSETIYKKISLKYPQDSEKELILKYFLYCIKHEEKFYDLDLISIKYMDLSRFLEYNEMRQDAYICKIMTFLTSSLSWFIFFWAKSDADLILQDKGSGMAEIWNKKAIDNFDKLCNNVKVPNKLREVKKLIDLDYLQLHDLSYSYDWSKYLDELREIYTQWKMDNIYKFIEKEQSLDFDKNLI